MKMEIVPCPDPHPFAHITKSPLARELLRCQAECKGESVAIDFVGDADKAHQRTASIRKTMGRHGMKLCYKREATRLILWAVKDETIDPTSYITKPRGERYRRREFKDQ